MRRLLPLVLGALMACSSQTATVTTATTISDVPISAAPTTTAPPMPTEVQDCGAPPATFKTLCETIELLEEWHVGGTPDMAALAGLAVEAIDDFESDTTEEPPRTFFCAIPSLDFEAVCEALAPRVAAEGLPVGAAMEAAVTHMVDVGLDPFTWYVPPELSKGFRDDGIVGGVGVLLDATDAAGSKCARIAETCPLRIVLVLEDNAGEDAGLLTGDVIVAIDGEPVLGKGFVDVATKIGGDETGTVVLTIERDGSSQDVTIERRPVEGPSFEIDLPVSGVAYLRIPDFGFAIPSAVDASIAAVLEGSPHTFIIDLRDNPGGLVDAVVSVASQFIESGPIMTQAGREGEFTYEAPGIARATSQRLIVLVNEGTASAAEILAGALHDRRSATVIGQPTFGKNAVQIPFVLRNGGEFHVAVAHWTTPSGTSVVDGGLIPDRIVEFPAGASLEELVDFALASA